MSAQIWEYKSATIANHDARTINDEIDRTLNDHAKLGWILDTFNSESLGRDDECIYMLCIFRRKHTDAKNI
jgi:hypothetical protein